jgi:hypothetical protein
MKTQIKHYRDALIAIEDINDKKLLVELFELLFNKLNLCSMQEMAERENKSYNGISKSNSYLKIKKGRVKLVCKGIRNDEDEFPW